MKKLFTLFLVATLASCNNPMSKVYTEDEFTRDMVEIEKTEDHETVEMITSYVIQKQFTDAFNFGRKASALAGKTYSEILQEAKRLEALRDAKKEEKKKLAEEERRVAEEERKKKKELSIKVSKSLTVALTKKNYYDGKYSYTNKITYTFMFTNKTNRDIAGVKGDVTFYDIFNEELKSISLSYDDGIKANSTVNYKIQTNYNSYSDKDKKLKNDELDKLKVVWKPRQLVFSDGENISLD